MAPWLEQTLQDLRFGARTFARPPGVALLATLWPALRVTRVSPVAALRRE